MPRPMDSGSGRKKKLKRLVAPGDTKDVTEGGRAPAYIRSKYPGYPRTLTDPKTGRKVPFDPVLETDLAKKVSNRKFAERKKFKRAKIVAPVIDVLEETTRPVHAVAGATRAALRGEDVLRAAGRGIRNEDRYTFSDVLEEAGAPKVVQAVGGFALDVAADPLTYATLGTGSVARKAAEKEGRRVLKKARGTGMSEEGAQRVAQRAAKNAAQKASPAKGVTVKLAGREVPGVRSGTAKAAEG